LWITVILTSVCVLQFESTVDNKFDASDKIDCDDVSVDVDEDFHSWSFDFRFFDGDDKKKDEIVLVFDMLEFIYF
jgi:hypothetical protein